MGADHMDIIAGCRLSGSPRPLAIGSLAAPQQATKPANNLLRKLGGQP